MQRYNSGMSAPRLKFDDLLKAYRNTAQGIVSEAMNNYFNEAMPNLIDEVEKNLQDAIALFLQHAKDAEKKPADEKIIREEELLNISYQKFITSFKTTRAKHLEFNDGFTEFEELNDTTEQTKKETQRRALLQSFEELIKKYQNELEKIADKASPPGKFLNDVLSQLKIKGKKLGYQDTDELQRSFTRFSNEASGLFAKAEASEKTISALANAEKIARIDETSKIFEKAKVAYEAALQIQKKLNSDPASNPLLAELQTQIEKCNQATANLKTQKEALQKPAATKPVDEVADLLARLKVHFSDSKKMDEDRKKIQTLFDQDKVDEFDNEVRARFKIHAVQGVANERSRLEKLLNDATIGTPEQREEMQRYLDLANARLFWHMGSSSKIESWPKDKSIYDHPLMQALLGKAEATPSGTLGDAVRVSGKPGESSLGNIARLPSEDEKQFVPVNLVKSDGRTTQGVMIKQKGTEIDEWDLDFHFPAEMNVLSMFFKIATKDHVTGQSDDTMRNMLNSYLLTQQYKQEGITQESLQKFLVGNRGVQNPKDLSKKLFAAYSKVYINPNIRKSIHGEYQPSDFVMQIAIKLVEMARKHQMEPITLSEIPGCRIDRQVVKAAVFYAREKNYVLHQNIYKNINRTSDRIELRSRLANSDLVEVSVPQKTEGKLKQLEIAERERIIQRSKLEESSANFDKAIEDKKAAEATYNLTKSNPTYDTYSACIAGLRAALDIAEHFEGTKTNRPNRLLQSTQNDIAVWDSRLEDVRGKVEVKIKSEIETLLKPVGTKKTDETANRIVRLFEQLLEVTDKKKPEWDVANRALADFRKFQGIKPPRTPRKDAAPTPDKTKALGGIAVEPERSSGPRRS